MLLGHMAEGLLPGGERGVGGAAYDTIMMLWLNSWPDYEA